MGLVKKARAFAMEAHAGVLRKGSGEPYFNHVERVALALAAHGFPDEVVAAGYLHDVVEDCPVSNADLVREFGPEVAALVAEVTKPKLPKTPGNRAWRKAIEAEHVAKTGYNGASLKLADIADNAVGCLAVPSFAKVYLPELVDKVAAVSHGHPDLVAKAKANISDGLASLPT